MKVNAIELYPINVDKYIGTMLSPCKFLGQTKTLIEVSDEELADMFSVYLIKEDNTLNCIADFNDRESAEFFKNILDNLL